MSFMATLPSSPSPSVHGPSSPSSIVSVPGQTVAMAAPAKKRKRSRALALDDSKSNKERCVIACNRCKSKKQKCRNSDDNPAACTSCIKASEQCVFEVGGLKYAGGTRYISALETRVAELESALAGIDPAHPGIEDHFPPRSPTMTKWTGGPDEEAHAPQESTFIDSTGAEVRSVSNPASSMTIPVPNSAGLPDTVVGSRSGLGLTRLLQTSIRSPRLHPIDNKGADARTPRTSIPVIVNSNPSLPPAGSAEDILRSLYRHVQARYPFMDWAQLRKWHDRREEICFCSSTIDPDMTPLNDQIGAFFVWIVYAVGVEFDSRDTNLESPETYFEQASKYLDAVTASYDFTTVRGMLLVLFYAFRSRSGPPFWLVNGFVMRLCVELGLYRKTSSAQETPLDVEVRKRLFWSAYAFDRVISLASGRPFSISDKDIDVELPADIDCEITDNVKISAMQASSPIAYTMTGQITTMSSAIHQIRLYRIRSRLHTAFYAIDAPPPSEEATKAFLAELDDWRRCIPQVDRPGYPVQPYNKMQMAYLQSVLSTLRPALLVTGQGDPRLTLCATAAAEACELSKNVHLGATSKHTILSVYHIFLCGITLLHCLCILPTVISSRLSFRAIRSCSSTLAVYAQLFPAALPFREMFEHIADEVLDDSSSRDGSSPGQAKAKNVFATAIGEILMGKYDQLAIIHDAINSRGKTTERASIDAPLSHLPVADSATLAVPVAQTDPSDFLAMFDPSPAAPQPLPFDAATFHSLSDLSAFLDFPLGTDFGWQEWGQ